MTNGDFQTGTAAPWYNNAANVVDLDVNLSGVYVNQANVTQAGAAYNVNLSQNISLNSGSTYVLKFDAFTDAITNSRTMIVGLGQNASPWTALTSTVTLSPTPQTFTFQYTINYGDAVGDRVIFDMGAATGYVFIDNVSVIQVVSTCNNGVQDGDETGVDCGGSCPVCVATPLVAAPTPPARPVADVVSIFSDAYSCLSVNEWGPDWGGYSARINDFPIQSNPTKVINLESGKVFAGIDFAPSLFDATSFTNLHLDYWIADPLPVGQVMSIKLSNHLGGAGETSAIEFIPSPLSTNQWVGLDIPLNSFTAASAPPSLIRNAMAQLIITAARADNNVPLKIYIDNIYFHKNTILGVSTFETSKIAMYPNPAKTSFTIDAQDKIEKVSVYNLLGQEIISTTPNNQSATINIAEFQIGVYLVKATINGNVATSRIVKE